jgi:hypothetical protein
VQAIQQDRVTIASLGCVALSEVGLSEFGLTPARRCASMTACSTATARSLWAMAPRPEQQDQSPGGPGVPESLFGLAVSQATECQ